VNVNIARLVRARGTTGREVELFEDTGVGEQVLATEVLDAHAQVEGATDRLETHPPAHYVRGSSARPNEAVRFSGSITGAIIVAARRGIIVPPRAPRNRRRASFSVAITPSDDADAAR